MTAHAHFNVTVPTDVDDSLRQVEDDAEEDEKGR